MRASIAIAFAGGAGASAQYMNATNSTSGYIHYETVTGYFLQDEPYTDPETFDYTAYNFGLMNRTYPDLDLAGNLTQWQKFEARVQLLNNQAPLNTVYKVLFMGRHGEGFHNAAQDYYGTPAWNCYWSLKNGNETVSWKDPDLTEEGIDQALIANSYWKSRIASQHIPYPQSYYSSPLTRCLRTANLTFADIPTPEYYPFVPTVKEFFREGISLHTCDWRRSKTYIQNLFPDWNIEEGFAELDLYWNGVTGETSDGQDKRSKIALDSVFNNDDHTWISITSHSGEIASMLRVLGHQSFRLNTGAVIPVLVKAVFLPSGPASSDTPFTTSTHCALPPITSGSDGCVCSGTASAGTTVGITTPIYNVSMSTTAASYPTAYRSIMETEKPQSVRETVAFKASCACTRITLQSTQLPQSCSACHCITCQKLSGGPFQAYAETASDALTLYDHQEKLRYQGLPKDDIGGIAYLRLSALGERAYCVTKGFEEDMQAAMGKGG
ncbi:phosphoglycerate mutase-like protein [Hortaea werneckii]|nr:phosphoglycerate mutase-like protein [Hortaea werneckii]KAI7238531.1 phosphoglycerate mutase-like protein [Hortaea werneckii]KAI7333976.1 phosphoglycerate mutase-like protein [Hortaea werneckii]KAI7388676.1 phosphoglycerate mutase-like protein [Hortaea werneckii]KAI7484638.1 phosphoglycerate mutase-like protein [Hortaea werneckii]